MAEKTIQTATETVPREERAPATRDDERFLVPPVDIFETEQALVVVADLPGVERDGLDVRVDEDMLTIQGRVPRENDHDTVLSEFDRADYFRQFRLSDQFDPGRISAQLKHGVLTLELAKAEQAKPRQIQVKVD